MLQDRPSRRRRIHALLLILTSILVACNSDPVAVEPSITSHDSSIFLAVGETRQLDVNRSPAGAVFEAVSDDLAVATVTQTSSRIAIRGVCQGFATIVLRMPAYPGIEFQITVEVEDELEEATSC